MKKHLCSCILFFSYCLLSGLLYAEAPQTSKTVNTAAAVRSLERATGFLGTADWQQASFEARLGSTYDPSIADFSYIEALSLAASSSPRADILERVEHSLSGGLFWRSYTKNDALVFAARLRSQTCDYETSLSFLDKLPKGFSSADADYVRILSYYGLAQIADARRLVSSSLERWPFDPRFPRIFLQRESSLRADAGKFENPPPQFFPASIFGKTMTGNFCSLRFPSKRIPRRETGISGCSGIWARPIRPLLPCLRSQPIISRPYTRSSTESSTRTPRWTRFFPRRVPVLGFRNSFLYASLSARSRSARASLPYLIHMRVS